MHLHIDHLGLRNLATVFVVSLVWHSGDRLVALFATHQTNSPTAASHQVASTESLHQTENSHPVVSGPIPRSERVATLNLGPPKVTAYVATAPRNFQERWPVSEPKRETTPFERRGMFDTKI